MVDLFFFLGVCLAVAIPAALVFWLGYSTAKSQNARHHQVIQTSYQQLIEETKKLADTEPHIARRAGWRDGYHQALEDLCREVQKNLEVPE